MDEAGVINTCTRSAEKSGLSNKMESVSRQSGELMLKDFSSLPGTSTLAELVDDAKLSSSSGSLTNWKVVSTLAAGVHVPTGSSQSWAIWRWMTRCAASRRLLRAVWMASGETVPVYLDKRSSASCSSGRSSKCS